MSRMLGRPAGLYREGLYMIRRVLVVVATALTLGLAGCSTCCCERAPQSAPVIAQLSAPPSYFSVDAFVFVVDDVNDIRFGRMQPEAIGAPAYDSTHQVMVEKGSNGELIGLVNCVHLAEIKEVSEEPDGWKPIQLKGGAGGPGCPQ